MNPYSSKHGVIPTKKQKEALVALRNFTEEFNEAPTVVELARYTEEKYPALHSRLLQLIRKGYLKHENGVPRDWELTSKAHHFLSSNQAA